MCMAEGRGQVTNPKQLTHVEHLQSPQFGRGAVRAGAGHHGGGVVWLLLPELCNQLRKTGPSPTKSGKTSRRRRGNVSS